jgi:hypothetical protein
MPVFHLDDLRMLKQPSTIQNVCLSPLLASEHTRITNSGSLSAAKGEMFQADEPIAVAALGWARVL